MDLLSRTTTGALVGLSVLVLTGCYTPYNLPIRVDTNKTAEVMGVDDSRQMITMGSPYIYLEKPDVDWAQARIDAAEMCKNAPDMIMRYLKGQRVGNACRKWVPIACVTPLSVTTSVYLSRNNVASCPFGSAGINTQREECYVINFERPLFISSNPLRQKMRAEINQFLIDGEEVFAVFKSIRYFVLWRTGICVTTNICATQTKLVRGLADT